MAGTLFVVATPIGHLDDMTARALRVLGEVDVIAAEDTRRTGNLLRHFGIRTRLVSLHEHNERDRAVQLLGQLEQGQSVAIVSDAGTPGISDPGADFVRLARDRGVRIEAVPGASAVAAAISVAGLKGGHFAFLGFPPTRSNDRIRWLQLAERLHQELAIVFFEAPHRIRRTLMDLTSLTNQSIYVFRELTKVHEEALVGPPQSVIDQLTAPRGEFTVVVPGAEVSDISGVTPSDSDVAAIVGQLTEFTATSKRAAAREIGKKFGLSARQVYELAKKAP